MPMKMFKQLIGVIAIILSIATVVAIITINKPLISILFGITLPIVILKLILEVFYPK